MSRAREIAARFDAYDVWRRRLTFRVSSLHDWLCQQSLADAPVELGIREVLARLREDKLIVAFFAERSCSKSELINALFFADAGRCLLPSYPERTTGCPTEILCDTTSPPSLRLLPIETHLKDAAAQAFRNFKDEWSVFPLDPADPGKTREVLARIAQTKQVSVALARALGLRDDDAESGDRKSGVGDDRAEVPCWRHAIVNFPHPLLQQGLVILDMAGLDAIGTDPDFSYSLLPRAHVAVLVLAADGNVTRSDLEPLRRGLAGEAIATDDGPIVVLDGLDVLQQKAKPERAVAGEIARLVKASAARLDLPPAQVHPVSAQVGLRAKASGDNVLLERSRLPALEETLSAKLVSVKHALVSSATLADVRALTDGVRALLDARQGSIGEQLAELRGLREKNQGVVAHMIDRSKEEEAAFERDLQRFNALRTVFTQHANALFDAISLEALRANAGRTRRGIERSPFTSGVRRAMKEFFDSVRRDFDTAAHGSAEIQEMMRAMHTHFAAELGAEPIDVPPFSTLKYQKEIDRLERGYNEHFNTLWNMLTRAKFSLTRRFFETVASRVKHVYEIANRDAEGWLRTVMTPLETQISETRVRFNRRRKGIERMGTASGELDARILELERQYDALAAQAASLRRAVEAVEAVALQPEALASAAEA
jgi:hypothetical protein